MRCLRNLILDPTFHMIVFAIVLLYTAGPIQAKWPTYERQMKEAFTSKLVEIYTNG